MTEKLIFNASMEGLIQAVRVEISPKCRTRMKEIGFDCDAKLLPAYPAEQWAGVVQRPWSIRKQKTTTGVRTICTALPTSATIAMTTMVRRINMACPVLQNIQDVGLTR